MYLNSCQITSECGYSTGLECISNQCQCNTSLFWNGTHCDVFKTYLQSCLTEQGEFSNISCLASQNLHCATNGQNAGFCSCNTHFYFNVTTSRCVAQKLNSELCSSSIECRNDLGLNCSGSCQCLSTFYWSSVNSICGSYLLVFIQILGEIKILTFDTRA
jgi:hypothetical protein